MASSHEQPLQPAGAASLCAPFSSWLQDACESACALSDASCSSNTSADLMCDAHCHLDLMQNATAVAQSAHKENLFLLNMGMAPDEFPAANARYLPYPNIITGIGLHPWNVDADCVQKQLDSFDEHVEKTRIVGEVGMDLSPAHAATADAQQIALQHILSTCAQQIGMLLSIHAVRSAHHVLDEIERFGTAEHNLCVFHWFSGNSDDLQRALRLGMLFSINPHMLQTKRGREYARVIPTDRMLFETDSPAQIGDACAASEIVASLRATATEVSALKNKRNQ